MSVSCFLKHVWQVLYWVAGRMRQDRATFQKTSVAGLHILKCLFYMVDNIRLTTLTQHVMVGITRSKVIFTLFLVVFHGDESGILHIHWLRQWFVLGIWVPIQTEVGHIEITLCQSRNPEENMGILIKLFTVSFKKHRGLDQIATSWWYSHSLRTNNYTYSNIKLFWKNKFGWTFGSRTGSFPRKQPGRCFCCETNPPGSVNKKPCSFVVSLWGHLVEAIDGIGGVRLATSYTWQSWQGGGNWDLLTLCLLWVSSGPGSLAFGLCRNKWAPSRRESMLLVILGSVEMCESWLIQQKIPKPQTEIYLKQSM